MPKEQVAASSQMVVSPQELATPPDDDSLIRYAIDHVVDIDKLGRLMDLVERRQKRLEKIAFTQSMVRFHQEPDIKILKKEIAQYGLKTGGQMSYRFSKLDQVVDVIGPKLAKWGVTRSWQPDYKENGELSAVTCILEHVAGGGKETRLAAAPDFSGGKQLNHANAAGITFWERYSLLCATGCATADMPQGERSKAEDKPATLDNATLGKCIHKISTCEDEAALQKYWNQLRATTIQKCRAMGDVQSEQVLIAAKDARKFELRGGKAEEVQSDTSELSAENSRVDDSTYGVSDLFSTE